MELVATASLKPNRQLSKWGDPLITKVLCVEGTILHAWEVIKPMLNT